MLRFDGIAGTATIYLNGCLLHHNYSAYNTFELDISDLAYRDRDNILAVYVNTQDHGNHRVGINLADWRISQTGKTTGCCRWFSLH